MTGRELILHFELGRLRMPGRRKLNRLMGELRQYIWEHGELPRATALVQAERFLREHQLLPRL